MKKNTSQKQTILNSQGFAHFVLPLVGVVGLVAVGTFTLVVKNHHTAQSAVASSPVSKLASNKSSAVSTVSNATPAAAAATTGATPAVAAKKSSSSAASNPVKTTAPKTTATPSSPAAPAATPLSTLTAIIAGLQNGTSAQVTANAVKVAGPVGDATARPIVFTLNGTTYYAYRQGQAADFNTSAATTAGTMAIIVATTPNAPLTSGYLDKSNNLTDPSFHSDGFSTY